MHLDLQTGSAFFFISMQGVIMEVFFFKTCSTYCLKDKCFLPQPTSAVLIYIMAISLVSGLKTQPLDAYGTVMCRHDSEICGDECKQILEATPVRWEYICICRAGAYYSLASILPPFRLCP